MTLEEKILHLRVAAMEEARAEKNAIMKRHEDALRGVFEQHKFCLLYTSCASGGGRFDPGMLYYAPQGWTSDD